MQGLRNVKLETGFHTESSGRVTTETELFDIRFDEGRITWIRPAEGIFSEEGWLDAEGRLAVPGITEKHVHLDKTYAGMSWLAPIPAKSVLERSGIEKDILAHAELSTTQRATNLMRELIQNGATSVRTHVDIYPEVGIAPFLEVQQVVKEFPEITTEIVAFAQHGLLHDETIAALKEAVARGADFVGAVDPATVDKDIEKSLRTLLDIASEGGVGVDLHLHDPGHLGLFTMQRLAELTCEYGLQGNVYVSHAFGLGDVSLQELEPVAKSLKEAGIGIITTVPIGRPAPPVEWLDQQGIAVYLGNDNIYDSWWPTGTGDLVERLGRLLEKNRWTHEKALAQSLRFITNHVVALDENGTRQWPQEGQDATMILTPAQCSAEFVARRTSCDVVIAKGKQMTM